MSKPDEVKLRRLERLIAYVNRPIPLPEDVRIELLELLQEQHATEQAKRGRGAEKDPTRTLQARLAHELKMMGGEEMLLKTAIGEALEMTQDPDPERARGTVEKLYRKMIEDGTMADVHLAPGSVVLYRALRGGRK
jgi:hypothetical protein